nr:hypothetical protein [Tanacetum cinerariifolium]
GVGKTKGGGGFSLGRKVGKGREVEDGYGKVWGIGRVEVGFQPWHQRVTSYFRVAKFFNEGKNFLFKWRIYKFLAKKIWENLEHIFESFKIKRITPFVHIEFDAMLVKRDNSPEFMHVDGRNTCRDQECLIERDMLQICPNIPGQKLVDPPFEEEILAFIKKLGYFGNMKSLSNAKVETLPQPRMLTMSNFIWEDLVYQIENKEINQFQEETRCWHIANDDPILTTMRFIPKHETVQKYDNILPDTITNQAIKELDAYKTYYDFATGKVVLKPNYVCRSTREKTDQAPKASPGKRLKATTKVAKSGKNKPPAKGLETLSEVKLSEAEQMRITIKRSKTQFYSSQAK